jgi:glycosyltransferase involved in cell wall biosynthesis
MKILQVISYFNPKFGGDVNSTFNLSKYLSNNGHEVTILTTDFKFDKNYAKAVHDEGVEVIPFHCELNIGLFIYSPSIKSWLKENIKRFDIIHMNNFRSYQNSVVHRNAIKFGIPYILQARGSVLPFFEKQRLKKIYDLVWGYNILKNTSKVIALTKTEVEQYKKMGVSEDKIVIIPNGVDLSLFDPLPEKGTFREKYDITSDTKIVLCLGRLHKIKGIDLLIDVFSEVKKEAPLSKLVIVGPDEGYLQNLQRQAEASNIGRDIIFTGPLYGKDKFAAFVDANVYVLPSIYDAFPNTVLEAWACMTPVIVTKGCCISDIVENAGYSVSYDKNELKDTILKVFNNNEETTKFRKNGKNLIEKTLNIDVCIKKIEEVYCSLIPEKHVDNKGERPL